MVRNLIPFKCVGQLLGDFDQKSDIIFVFVTMYNKTCLEMIPISEQLVEGNRAKMGEEQKFDYMCKILNVFERH